jgi:hypothetical protein
VPLDRVRLTAAKSGFGRHRKLRLARPPGSAPVSASDDELRLARPQGSNSTSALEDDELHLARPRAQTWPRFRKTTNSASPDPRARTQPRLWKTTNSASPDPQGSDSTLSSDDGLRLTQPGARTRPRPRKTDSTSTSKEPPPRPTQGSDRPHHRGAIITLPIASSGNGEQDRRPIWLAPVNK